KWLYHHSLYCIPTTVSSVLNCARMPAAERLEEPLPNWAFSSTVTRKPCSASRTAISAPVAPPPITTTCSAEVECAMLSHPPFGTRPVSVSPPLRRSHRYSHHPSVGAATPGADQWRYAC